MCKDPRNRFHWYVSPRSSSSSRREITKSPPPRRASGRKLVGASMPSCSIGSLSNSRLEVASAPRGRNTRLPSPSSSTCPADFSFPAFHASARIYFTRPRGTWAFVSSFCKRLRAFFWYIKHRAEWKYTYFNIVKTDYFKRWSEYTTRILEI